MKMHRLDRIGHWEAVACNSPVPALKPGYTPWLVPAKGPVQVQPLGML
jgi:hypothetical protein